MSRDILSSASTVGEDSSENHLHPPNRQSSTRRMRITDLSHQLEETKMYCMESEMNDLHVALRNRPSMNTRDSGGSGFGSNNRLSRSTKSGEMSVSKPPEEPVVEIDSEDEYIRDFAKRCAEFPGRKPVLLDIQNSIPLQQRSQFPIILVYRF